MSGRPTDDPRVNVRRTAPSVPAAHRLADDACGPRSRARGPTRPELAVAPPAVRPSSPADHGRRIKYGT
ncbi:hypothetical protein MBT84_19700 [Streptomyces sp. MBT84]|nr:hypothetical protein [Streptomyces sp. MBT84]